MQSGIAVYERVCLNCNRKFVTKILTKIFCRPKCRMDKWMKEHPRKEVQRGQDRRTGTERRELERESIQTTLSYPELQGGQSSLGKSN